eukprot:COSAG02_NODE_7329_length_3061_cov_2.987508_3_plen_239_part_00
MVESPSSESLSSLSRWGAEDQEEEVVSMASTQEGENFAVGEAIENLIEKLNGTPRSEDSTESIHALLNEAVVAGGSNLRENMALYFATKRGLEFGMQRDVIDEIIADAAVAVQNGVGQSIEVSCTPASSAADDKPHLSTVGVKVAQVQSDVNAMKHAEGAIEDELPDLVPDVVDDLLTVTTSSGAPSAPGREAPGAAVVGSGALLPPPEHLKPGAIGSGGRSVKAAPAPASSRAGSLQ